MLFSRHPVGNEANHKPCSFVYEFLDSCTDMVVQLSDHMPLWGCTYLEKAKYCHRS